MSDRDEKLRAVLQHLAVAPSDRAAWAELYVGMWPYACAVAYRVVGGDRALAEDGAQEGFFRLARYARFERLQTPAEFRAYFGRVVESAARNIASSRRRDRVPAGVDLPERDVSPDPQLVARELLEEITEQLEGEERALALLLTEGRSLEEIGEALDITKQTAGVRVHRLRVKLRRLSRNPAEDDDAT